MKKIFYDVETTGTNWFKHSIIQLSGIIQIDGEIIETFDYKLRPHPKAKIEESALRVNKTSELDLLSYPHAKDVHKQFIQMLSRFVDKYDKKDKFWLVGFNNRAFDDYFLRMHFDLMKDQWIGSWFWNNTIDVMVLASQHLMDTRKNMPSFKLKRVAKQLGIEVKEDKLHEALYDCYLTKGIYDIVTEYQASLF